MNERDRRVIAVIREKYGDRQEFTSGEIWDELKDQWKTFKIKKGKMFWILNSLMKRGLLEGRQTRLKGWAWSSGSLQWRWRLAGVVVEDKDIEDIEDKDENKDDDHGLRE